MPLIFINARGMSRVVAHDAARAVLVGTGFRESDRRSALGSHVDRPDVVGRPMNLNLGRLPTLLAEQLPVEIVERKGLGHPDNICDAVADPFSLAHCRCYVDRIRMSACWPLADPDFRPFSLA